MPPATEGHIGNGLRAAVFASRTLTAVSWHFHEGLSSPAGTLPSMASIEMKEMLPAPAYRLLRFRDAVAVPHVSADGQGDGYVQGVDYREIDDVGGYCISGLAVGVKGPEPLPEK